MRPGPHAGRSSAASRYALVALVALGCRVGYETLPRATGGDAGSSPLPTSGSGGVMSSSAGGDEPDPAGGAAALGGASAGGTTPHGGVPGDAGQPAAGGASGGASSGGAPATGDCQTTVDCTCEAFDGHSYWFCATPAMAGPAEILCATQGMTLVRIDSQPENDFLSGAATGLGLLPVGGFVQIGATAQAVDGEWRWRDGTQFWQGFTGGMAVGGLYENWLDSSPSNSGIKACAGMVATGEWQDRSCTADVAYVCESL